MERGPLKKYKDIAKEVRKAKAELELQLATNVEVSSDA